MQILEDYPQTHEGGVAFVRDVFQSMGGTVVNDSSLMGFVDAYCENGISFLKPGSKQLLKLYRPGKTKQLYMRLHRDAFLMDFEISCLANNWDSSSAPHPTGVRRHENEKWAELIQSQVYPNHSDVDWYDYVEWVSQGGGDEWFQEKRTIYKHGRIATNI